jgi:hemerythrin-like domain-containing protein
LTTAGDPAITLDDADPSVVLKIFLFVDVYIDHHHFIRHDAIVFPRRAEQIARGLEHENVINLSLLMWG